MTTPPSICIEQQRVCVTLEMHYSTAKCWDTAMKRALPSAVFASHLLPHVLRITHASPITECSRNEASLDAQKLAPRTFWPDARAHRNQARWPGEYPPSTPCASDRAHSHSPPSYSRPHNRTVQPSYNPAYKHHWR